jgi:hypothetical protein
MDAASYTKLLQISAPNAKFYDHEQMSGSLITSHTQKVWSAYSKDQDIDYYIVQSEIVLPNENIYKGTWHKYHFPLEWKESALYMRGLEFNSKLLGANGQVVALGGSSGGVTIPSSNPATANNTTSVTSGMSWNVGGNVTVGGGEKGPSGSVGVSGGVSFSKSSTVTIEDVEVVNNSMTDGANAKWNYTTNKRSTYQVSKVAMGDPANLAKNTAQFTHIWRWEVNKPKSYNGGDNGSGAATDTGRFGITTDFSYTMEEAGCAGASQSAVKYWNATISHNGEFVWWFPSIQRNNTQFN